MFQVTDDMRPDEAYRVDLYKNPTTNRWYASALSKDVPEDGCGWLWTACGNDPAEALAKLALAAARGLVSFTNADGTPRRLPTPE